MPSTWHVILKNDNFNKVLESSRQQAEQIIRKAGSKTIGHIKDTIVETGSVETWKMHDTVDEYPLEKPLIFGIGIGVDYWQYTNDGTPKIPARYWLEEGISRGIEDFNMAVEAWVKRKR